MYVHRNFDLPAGTAVRPPVFDEPGGDIDAYLSAEGLPRGRTVVLAPHAVTLKSPVSHDFWTRLAGELSERGFTVCTNVAGTEEPLPGTRALSFAPEHAVPILDALGYLISVRSGLCDLVSSSTATKIVLFESGPKWRKATLREYLTLDTTVQAGVLLELDYSPDAAVDILHTILPRFEEGTGPREYASAS